MGLEDDLKAKTLALISQQMANWVVEIQRSIQEHQANLVRNLDEMQETVARYDEKINEADVAAAMNEVVAQNPPAPTGPELREPQGVARGGGEGVESLGSADLPGQRGLAVRRSRGHVHRQGTERHRLVRARHRPAEVIKQVSVPLNTDTVFRLAVNSRHAERGSSATRRAPRRCSPGWAAIPRGSWPCPSSCATRWRPSSTATTTQDEVPGADADLIEILVSLRGQDHRPPDRCAQAGGGEPDRGVDRERAAAIRQGGDEIRERAGVPPSRPNPPAPHPPPPPQRRRARAPPPSCSTQRPFRR